jgi:alkanesulfonate monooxygenase SsuD/methylene tetrahydromethanopterin reductase-like flavin-dependent oxidoreductase (luciferase family)
MKIETTIAIDDFHAIAAQVRRAEELGYDGVVVPETSHNPYMGLTLAAEHSRRLRLATNVAQAFVRSPTTTAYAAFDLQRYSNGRFFLGLGSQVKGQIERRFGMPWSARAGRTLDGFDISGGGLIVTAPTRDELAPAIEHARWTIAYYGSTRTYRGVWEQHGWEQMSGALHELSVANRWTEMAALVTDEMVRTFAAVGTYEEIGERVLERFGSYASSVPLPLPAPEHEAKLRPSLRLIQEAKSPVLAG